MSITGEKTFKRLRLFRIMHAVPQSSMHRGMFYSPRLRKKMDEMDTKGNKYYNIAYGKEDVCKNRPPLSCRKLAGRCTFRCLPDIVHLYGGYDAGEREQEGGKQGKHHPELPERVHFKLIFHF